MPLIRPFAGLRPVPEHAADVVAPPYDVLNTEEARERAAGRPWSFLHISKPEIDLPEGTDPYDPAVYAKGAENLHRMIDQGVLRQDERPCYYIYRLEMDGHVQTGIVAAASVAAYDTNRIRKHEFTRPEKEDDRVRQIDALDAQTGPVFLVFKHRPEIRSIFDEVTAQTPVYDLTSEDGVRHTVWVLADETRIDRLSALFEAMPNLYVADGHHRSAAASRVCAERKAANPKHTGDEPYNYFLTVIFPDDEMRILDYNRVVSDLNGLDREGFLARVGERFDITASDSAVRPKAPGHFGLYLPGQWYALSIRHGHIPQDDPVARLDVSLLQDNLVSPVLGIDDPRRDRRIDFVGGIRGLQELERRVDEGGMAAAFSLYPTSMQALMSVADAGEVMPPKSTWFEPKLADGLVSHML